MKITLDWLNDFVDLSDKTPADVAALLTSVGLEVEGISGGSPIGPEVVVGKILTAVQHPNADALRLCTVDAGEAEPLAIVCGAPNARAGIHVVVAKIGATLPGDFKIKKSKIRGETSHGMLCSAGELGLEGDDGGIIELPEAVVIGSAASKALGLENAVLELNVTPNRGDCLGVYGVARDLATKLKRVLKRPAIDLPVEEGFAAASGVSVRIEDSELCPRFVALPMRGVKVVPSPRWMQKRLEAVGLRPINLLVDATNYVMMETGQPVHAYDARQLKGSLLRVRAARTGETLRTLDGQDRKLEDGDILIVDDEAAGGGILGLAGIMGGASSEVKDDTTDIVIEVAAFSPRQIRRTAKRLALHTDASHRFERGTDVDAVGFVAARVAKLISEGLAAAKAPAPRIATGLVDEYPAEISKKVVALRFSVAKQFLALAYLTREEVSQTLTGLGFEYLDGNEDRMVFEVPYGRNDIEREVDLFEEIARIAGYDKIPYQLPTMSIRPLPEDPLIAFGESARRSMAEHGFRETISFPFLAAAELSSLGIPENHPLWPSVALANPLSASHSLMQTTLVPGLLRAAISNRRHGTSGTRLFEVGRGYFDFAAKPFEPQKWPAWKALSRPSRHIPMRARGDQGRVLERQWLAAVIDQPATGKAWNQAETRADFFHGKAVVMALLQGLGLASTVTWTRPQAADLPHLHPGAAALVQQGGRVLGYVGELHPAAADELGFSAAAGNASSPLVIELDLEALLDARAKAEQPDATMLRFPPVTRDFAFQVKTEKTHADFEKAIAGFKQRRNLRDHRLFDVYEGANMASGMKSMAYRFAFQSPDRTLTDQEVDQEVGALLAWLNQSLEAQQR